MDVQFLMVSQQNKLLQDNPSLESSFDTRRKYLDPLNHLQVLHFWRIFCCSFLLTICCKESLLFTLQMFDN